MFLEEIYIIVKPEIKFLFTDSGSLRDMKHLPYIFRVYYYVYCNPYVIDVNIYTLV